MKIEKGSCHNLITTLLHVKVHVINYVPDSEDILHAYNTFLTFLEWHTNHDPKLVDIPK